MRTPEDIEKERAMIRANLPRTVLERREKARLDLIELSRRHLVQDIKRLAQMEKEGCGGCSAGKIKLLRAKIKKQQEDLEKKT